ncbi:MAG: transglutaminase family protein [Gammaproteobacteria bacterium]
MSIDETDFTGALAQLDACIAERGLDIWVGTEPTFTLAASESAEWLSEPLGGDKEDLARRLLERLRRRHPGALTLRSVGRQYAEEKRPRWSYGLYAPRDGSAIWNGPADPLSEPGEFVAADAARALVRALAAELAARGWTARQLAPLDPTETNPVSRLIARAPSSEAGTDDTTPDSLPTDDPALERDSVHECKTPADGLRDDLAERGLALFLVKRRDLPLGGACLSVELPALPSVEAFLTVIAALQTATHGLGTGQLIIQGYPPPVDDSVSWTTVTPDPAVIEINSAPATDLASFHRSLETLYTEAECLGLRPWRAHYNGRITDSGGGGQITLGGPSPETSPFFRAPALLPRLVRYLNQHPALSYRFATDYLGSASQSPRPDEAVRERFLELELALARLEGSASPEPEYLWASLAPFLADSSGNSHRSELNIEKLWNPHLPGRGQLGLVEFRAFRMPHSARRAAALAALLRAITALLSDFDPRGGLTDWGDELHDRFALPWYLEHDLRAVFAELESHGLGLDQALRDELLMDPHETRWVAEHGGLRLEIRRAIEFWPLVGDTATQEGSGSRLVDSSTVRLELILRATGPDAPAPADCVVRVLDRNLPMTPESDAEGALMIAGVRYREFQPWRGLHPDVPPTDPVVITLSHPDLAETLEARLHGWQPQGKPYPGLPSGTPEARQRLSERLVVETKPRIDSDIHDPRRPRSQGGNAGSGLTLDLRWPR